MTTIARGVKVEGDFTSQGDVVIEGEVHGTLSASGLLTIGPEAIIKADVTAGEALVAGTIQGNVAIGKRIELKSSAKVIGDVTAEVMAIEAGATLAGRISVGERRAESAERTASAKRERGIVQASA